MLVLSNAYLLKKNYSDALDYAVQSTVIQENQKTPEKLADSYSQVGKVFYDWSVFDKSAEYLKKAYDIYEQNNLPDKKLNTLELLGNAYFQHYEKDKAKETLLKCVSLAKESNNKGLQVKSLDLLSLIAKENQQYEEALKYAQENLEIQGESKNYMGISQAENNVGYLYRRLKNYEQSTKFLERSVTDFEKLNSPNPEAINNLGVTYTHTNEFLKASEQYDYALKIYSSGNNYQGMAETNNYKASNEYLQGKNPQALKLVEDAIVIGERENLKETLADSYFLLSEIYAAMGDFKRSQEAYKKHLEIKKSLEDLAKTEKEGAQKKRLNAEEKENQVRLLMADKENQLLAFRQSQLEAEKKAQELELVKSEKELQSTQLKNQELEKQRAQQALTLARQQLENERRQQQIANLEKEREIQQLALKQKELEEKERQNELALLSQQNELLERDKKLHSAQLEEEQLRRNFSYGIIALVSLLLILAIVAFLRNRKQKQLIEAKSKQLIIKQKELEAQQAIVIQKNKELEASEVEIRQNAEELQTINDQLNVTIDEVHKQKELIEKKNVDITSSINYAKRIQSAILPRVEAIRAFLPEFFVFFEPRDIVSGDFYWYTVRKGKVLLVTGDCTGHGVPGAFMSMVGTNLLNLVVLQRDILNPEEILKYMQEGVYNSLRQKETQSKDGMELGILVYDRKDKSVEYAGSRRPLLYVTEGQPHEIKADKLTIGGEMLDKDSKEEFTKHTIPFTKETYYYLFTDGFQDQFGGEKDTKYGSKRFKEFLFSIHHLKIEEQKNALKTEFDRWKGSQSQIDDVLVMGLKIK
jgi:tetratricopeptide (TPR) repeat protein